MGSLNATGHVLVVSSIEGEEAIPAVWDLLDEMAVRHTGDQHAAVTVHSLGRRDDEFPRYCVHPSGAQDFEVQGDDLHETLLKAALALAERMDPNDLWRRE